MGLKGLMGRGGRRDMTWGGGRDGQVNPKGGGVGGKRAKGGPAPPSHSPSRDSHFTSAQPREERCRPG